MHTKITFLFQLHVSSDDVPTKLSSTIQKAELNSKQIDHIKEKRAALAKKVERFLAKTEPLTKELDKRFKAISRLEEVVAYLKVYTRIEELRFVHFMFQCRFSARKNLL